MQQLKEQLLRKIKILSETIWDRRATKDEIDKWLENFQSEDKEEQEKERLHALYLLSQFMYFASNEVRELLCSMYRDLIRYPIIESIRKSNNDTKDICFIEGKLNNELSSTRFLGVGNPSESGAHLLYYFRQENLIDTKLFINSHEIFTHNANNEAELADNEVKRYIFIDDFSGSGRTVIRYSKDVIDLIKRKDETIEVWYFALFANQAALSDIREKTSFDRCDAVYKLDDTYKCFGAKSRYSSEEESIDISFAKDMASNYGNIIYPDHPLGYDGNELLLGFFHNIPNNTLPIIWSGDNPECKWNPIFKRYPKKYGDISW